MFIWRYHQTHQTAVVEMHYGKMQLPESFGSLMFAVMNLNLQKNQLDRLPGSFCQLINLTMLDLSHNRLTRLPKLMGQLTGLKSLRLRDNKLNRLPKSIGQLKRLHFLELTHSQLSRLPESLGWLPELVILHLSANQLTHLPKSFNQLTKLLELDLCGNELIHPPDALVRLTNILRLDLGSNRIDRLPVWMIPLEFDELSLMGNRCAGSYSARRGARDMVWHPGKDPPLLDADRMPGFRGLALHFRGLVWDADQNGPSTTTTTKQQKPMPPPMCQPGTLLSICLAFVDTHCRIGKPPAEIRDEEA